MELKLGYKQTEMGVIPEEWEIKNLGALVRYTNGKAHEKSISDSGRYVVVNSKFISSEGLTRKYSNHCFCPTSKGDVLMVMSDVPNGKAIAKCYWVDRDGIYTVNQRICALSPQGVDGKLLFYKLDRNPFYLAFDDGAKQTNLRKDDVLACPLGIPKSDDEQRAMAGALMDVDALLGALTQLITKKRHIKQAAMQQLLTAKTRLPGYSEEWKTEQLGNVGKITMGQSPPGDSYSLNSSGLPLLNGAVDLTQDGIIVSQYTNSPTRVSKKGDLLFCIRATIGNLQIADREYCLGRGVAALTVEAAYDLKFIVYQLKGLFSLMNSRSEGGVIKGLRKDDVGEFAISVPKQKAEQTAIGEVLSDMDANLAALEQRRNKTRALKQGMMQELLTGRTRLV
jgi:type I restriction enzyme S subunit